MTDFTILIAAKDAADTIVRAVSSCLDEAAPILLIDDHSSDATVARARACAGARLQVIRAADPGGVARARQTGLDRVETPFAAWLDADDAWIAGRAPRLGATLDAGADVAVESIDLHDGRTGARLRTLDVPAYLRKPGAAVRLFERNALPGDTQVAFRVSTFREAGGYDASLHGPESYDLLLRVIRAGGRLACGEAIGYRMFAYPGSVSRDIGRQQAATAAALRKHAYEDVRRLYQSAGYDPRITAWALVAMALFREEPAAAWHFLEEAAPAYIDPDDTLEPAGPWPFCEGWRRAFHRGTIQLLLGRPDHALVELRAAETASPTPEGANNLGVAHARLGRVADARRWFGVALDRQPGYYDAGVNLIAETPGRVTRHPLRRAASRTDYQVPGLAAPGPSSRPPDGRFPPQDQAS